MPIYLYLCLKLINHSIATCIFLGLLPFLLYRSQCLLMSIPPPQSSSFIHPAPPILTRISRCEKPSDYKTLNFQIPIANVGLPRVPLRETLRWDPSEHQVRHLYRIRPGPAGSADGVKPLDCSNHYLSISSLWQRLRRSLRRGTCVTCVN